MSGKIPVWSWRQAVAKTKVPTLTKALCWAIANYLSDAGKGAWPSLKTLIDDTGMSERSITEHLRKAETARLLITHRERYPNGTLGPRKFHPRFPPHTVLASDVPPEAGGIAVNDEKPPAPSSGSPPAAGAEPPAPSAGQENISTRELSKKKKGGATPPPAAADDFSILEDWELPESFRSWATKESPEHAGMIETEAKKFKRFWREKAATGSEAEWLRRWQSWFERTIARPPAVAAKIERHWSDPNWSGATVHNTDEPYPIYRARMIREGKLRADA